MNMNNTTLTKTEHFIFNYLFLGEQKMLQTNLVLMQSTTKYSLYQKDDQENEKVAVAASIDPIFAIHNILEILLPNLNPRDYSRLPILVAFYIFS